MLSPARASSVSGPVAVIPFALALGVLVGCAPAATKGSGSGDNSQAVGLLEDMVNGHFTVFQTVEDLASDGGIELESERGADWPQSGDATVTLGQSTVGTVFTVDRNDFTNITRTWSVQLTLTPMEASGDRTTGEMTGIWDYWEEGDDGDTTGWVVLDLDGLVASAD